MAGTFPEIVTVAVVAELSDRWSIEFRPRRDGRLTAILRDAATGQSWRQVVVRPVTAFNSAYWSLLRSDHEAAERAGELGGLRSVGR
jgi:hypothetical protein